MDGVECHLLLIVLCVIKLKLLLSSSLFIVYDTDYVICIDVYIMNQKLLCYLIYIIVRVFK